MAPTWNILPRLANRYGYVFTTVRPGAVPAHQHRLLGPPKRVAAFPRPALTRGGSSTFDNVDQPTFSQDGRSAFQVSGFIPGPLEATPHCR